ncbi:MAG: putative reductase [Acidimicrobiia bacterium]|nr:putative reductase [Acidimicrobiia bacterium]
MSKLQIIVGSTRQGRGSDKITPWVLERARAHEAFDVELLDLRDWPLPMFQEHMGSIGDMADPTYSEPIVRQWNHKIAEGDAYLVITPEYNHSIPAVLKNAIDSVFIKASMRNKPIAAVSYSVGVAAGVRAIEHLAHVAIEMEMAVLRSSVIIPKLPSAFDDKGYPIDPMTEIALEIVLEDLGWWSKALERARAEGQLQPGKSRAYAMLAARQAAAASA